MLSTVPTVLRGENSTVQLSQGLSPKEYQGIQSGPRSAEVEAVAVGAMALTGQGYQVEARVKPIAALPSGRGPLG